MAFDAVIITLAGAIVAALFQRYAPDAYMVRNAGSSFPCMSCTPLACTRHAACLMIISLKVIPVSPADPHPGALLDCRTSGSTSRRRSATAEETFSTGTPKSPHFQASTCWQHPMPEQWPTCRATWYQRGQSRRRAALEGCAASMSCLRQHSLC